LKIIFDQSAFHDHLDLLKGSRLQHLTQDGKVTVCHTATFLDETLRMGDSAREELKLQWPFLQSICNGGWFKPLLFGQPPKLKSVCDEELDESPKDHNWPAIPSSSRTEIEAKVIRFLEGSGAFPELISTQPVYERIEEVKKDNKPLRLKLRTEHNLPKGVTFREYHKANFLDAAQLLIQRPRGSRPLQPLAALDQPKAKFDAWKRDPTKFPHFTAFVGFLIYSLYDAEKNQNSPLDRNWQGDAEQLCFLVDVDAMVSSDLRFMKEAFEALWQPTPKHFFTPEEFVAFLSQL
jgi:hypothetical protein